MEELATSLHCRHTYNTGKRLEGEMVQTLEKLVRKTDDPTYNLIETFQLIYNITTSTTKFMRTIKPEPFPLPLTIFDLLLNMRSLFHYLYIKAQTTVRLEGCSCQEIIL